MAFACPHCTKSIDNVVPKDRFDAVNTAKATAETELKEARKKATAYDALAPEVDDLRAKLTELPTLQEQLKALNAEKITAVFTGHGITGERVQKVVQAEFDEQAATENGEKDLGKWIATVKALPKDQRPELLRYLLPEASTGTPPSTPPNTPPATPPRTLPREITPPATPPNPGGKMTPAQLQAYLASPEYRNLPPAEQRTKFAELRNQTAAPAQPAT